MAKKASLNDKIFDFIYDSTFWPDYMGNVTPLLGSGGLKKILEGARSKREARNRLLLAYRTAQEDGSKGFGELMDRALKEYAGNYMEPGDAMPEFLWSQEKLADLYGGEPPNLFPSSRDYVANYGKLARLLKNPTATEALYRKLGHTFDRDPEFLYEYVSGITDRANRIRQRKEAGTPFSKAYFSPILPKH